MTRVGECRLSIIIPVLNSHEVVRRQLAHFERIGIPEDTELVLVDDGSDPPIDEPSTSFKLRIVRTGDTRPWIWALARNAGARFAAGRMLLMTDIDHILGQELIDSVRESDYQKVQFKREFGVLTDAGELTQDYGELRRYGLPESRLRKTGVKLQPLTNNFAMRADVFWKLGGYREDLVDRPYPQGEDRLFRKQWGRWVAAGKGEVDVYRPTIYMFPNGYYCGDGSDVDYNPFDLFHRTTRKTRRNPLYAGELGEGTADE